MPPNARNLRERLFALEQVGIKLGLDNIAGLLDALNRPDRDYRTIHIAGTNGKGSVSAMVERGLRAAGVRTGRYTSPHLVDIEERAAIDGSPVDAGTFDDVTGTVFEAVDDLRRRGVLTHSPTFFEVTTAAAFEIFRRKKVAVAVVEVGLGGRYDATNVVEPAITAITSIALDHERYLGSTLEAIAFEKAGIIKPGVPLVVGPVPQAAREVIERVAQERQAPVFHATMKTGARGGVLLSLPGAHQVDNAAVAVQVLELAASQGLAISRDNVRTALTDTDWPARLEWLRCRDSGEVLIDAAHNPAGASALAAFVVDTTQPLPLVFGVMKDKDVDAMVRALIPAVSRIIATDVASPRALDADALAKRVRAVAPGFPVAVERDPLAAIAQCVAENGRVVVAGSIFLVGPVRQQLLAQGATPVRYPSKASLFYLE